MAITSSCCLNLTPPTSTTKINNTQVPWFIDEKKWKGQCVMGVACMILGSEMGDLFMGCSQTMAQEVRVVQESRGPKWSDKRKCPPWLQNSLETIVPENLPRPSAQRRWEGVGYSKTAPPVKVMIVRKTNGGCFSM